jgi:phosphohistidine swiveling domain-containing protein
MYSGKWRIKPSGKLPIFSRFLINSSFTPENTHKAKLKNVIGNRAYLHHMMYWPAEEYNPFEAEIIGHLKKNDGWFEGYVKRELKDSEFLYNKGLELRKTDWSKKTNAQMKKILDDLLYRYRIICCAWYAQYPLDEYFEGIIEQNLLDYIKADDYNFRHYVLVFTDPYAMTEVAEERWKLVKLAKDLFTAKENLDKLSKSASEKINKHLEKFAYINRGLATSKAYTFKDMVNRVKEFKKQVVRGESIDNLIYQASAKKIADEFKAALKQIKPSKEFLRIIRQARTHSYMRNRRVEAFINADYGADFMYREIARRVKFNPDWVMEVSIPEMYGALKGNSLPGKKEMLARFKNYAMVVKNAKTEMITDPVEIKKLEQKYFVDASNVRELHGTVACLGGIIRGKAKVCLDKKDIGKVKSGDILVAQFTTPDYVPAMEKAAAIVADQGGLSSHAAIVSRELGVPCVIATKTGTRAIHDNDLLEVDARKGIVRILNK